MCLNKFNNAADRFIWDSYFVYDTCIAFILHVTSVKQYNNITAKYFFITGDKYIVIEWNVKYYRAWNGNNHPNKVQN